MRDILDGRRAKSAFKSLRPRDRGTASFLAAAAFGLDGCTTLGLTPASLGRGRTLVGLAQLFVVLGGSVVFTVIALIVASICAFIGFLVVLLCGGRVATRVFSFTIVLLRR